MDPLLYFLLGVVAAAILAGISILVAIKISRKQKKETKENTAHLSTDHEKILKNQERQERIQKRVVGAFLKIYNDEYPDMPLTEDSRLYFENTACTTAETMVNFIDPTKHNEDKDPPKDQE